MGVVAFQVYRYAEYFTLDSLRVHKQVIEDFIQHHYWLSIFLFGLLYIIDNVFSLPIAGALMLGAGYFYGLVPAFFMSLVAIACGASTTFFLSRFFIGGSFKVLHESEVHIFNTEFKHYGRFYLLLVRLLPFIPYIVVNIFAGALRIISYKTFLWTTIIGMMPLVYLHVSAGQKLQTIHSMYEIFSWQAIALLSFLVLIILGAFVVHRTQFNGYYR